MTDANKITDTTVDFFLNTKIGVILPERALGDSYVNINLTLLNVFTKYTNSALCPLVTMLYIMYMVFKVPKFTYLQSR